MLLICPLRPGDSNEELRYAMRSWEANLLYPEGLELWTVGYKPSWVEPDRHLDGNWNDSAQFNVFHNVFESASVAALYDYAECVFMNDDFFCMDPMASVLPVRRDISLAAHVAMFPENSMQWWASSLRLTASWLASEGLDHPWSFEVHRPLLASPAAMYGALSMWEQGDHEAVPQWRTVYGNLSGIYAYPVADPKLSSHVSGVGTPWISTSDQTWRRYRTSIEKRFPNPSRWER